MKITNNIHQLRIDFKIKINATTEVPRFVNVLLIFGDKITLIDTGVKGSEQIIYNYIREQGRNINEIETIIISHSHPDHIGSAAKIKADTNCQVCAHALEQDWIENIEKQNHERPVPGFYELVDTPVCIDVLLTDFQQTKLAENIILLITTSPGHSKGMLNILFCEDKILFTADSIPLKNDIPNYDNFLELKSSLKKIKEDKSYSTLLTSWTPALTNLDEIEKIIAEGEAYLNHIDTIVKKYYSDNRKIDLVACSKVINELSLPPFLANAITNRAFRSHLI